MHTTKKARKKTRKNIFLLHLHKITENAKLFIKEIHPLENHSWFQSGCCMLSSDLCFLGINFNYRDGICLVVGNAFWDSSGSIQGYTNVREIPIDSSMVAEWVKRKLKY